MTESQEFWIKITQGLLIVVVLILALYDTFVMYWVGREATITDVVYKISLRWPVIPAATGAVVAHLFWR